MSLGTDQKRAIQVTDAQRAEMIAAANAIACKDFPLDRPELENDKHEQKQDSSNAQDRSTRGPDGGRA